MVALVVLSVEVSDQRKVVESQCLVEAQMGRQQEGLQKTRRLYRHQFQFEAQEQA